MAHSALQSPSSPYTAPRIYLHWLSAAVILWATLSGFGVTALAVDHPLRQWVENVNPQITSLFIPLFAWRLWLYLSASSEQSVDRGRLRKRIARMTHTLIYLSVTGVLLTGVMMMNHPVRLLGILPLPQLLHSLSALAAVQQLHHLLCALLAVLVLLHLAAVLQHELGGRSVLHRML